MLSWIRISSASILCLCAVLVLPLQAQNTEMVQVGPPPLHRAEPPAPAATAGELDKRGDDLRIEKNYLDAIDYYEAAIRKTSGANSSLLNKVGISQLMLQRYKEAKKSFERAIKADNRHADAYNNLGVIYYQAHNYGKAIKLYQKAISFNQNSSSYFSNLGAAYCNKKDFEKASANYSKALELDPDIFERTSHAGVQAQLPSPEDRARYDYMLAKLYASKGVAERSLHYLKKAMEDGYKEISNVYTDNDFGQVRKDPRFAELMAAKTVSIPE